MKFLKNIFLVVLILIFSYFVTPFLRGVFSNLYGTPSGLFSSYGEVALLSIGFVLVYIFLLFLIFTTFGDKYKYWWIGVLLIPALVFEVYFDIQHIYFPIILGVLGWGIGWGVRKILDSQKHRELEIPPEQHLTKSN